MGCAVGGSWQRGSDMVLPLLAILGLMGAALTGLVVGQGGLDPALHSALGVGAVALAIGAHVREGGGLNLLASMGLLAGAGLGLMASWGVVSGGLHATVALSGAGLSVTTHGRTIRDAIRA